MRATSTGSCIAAIVSGQCIVGPFQPPVSSPWARVEPKAGAEAETLAVADVTYMFDPCDVEELDLDDFKKYRTADFPKSF